ncbi:MAG: xanthine dehydrogenase family protein subunit M [Planktomarina sp.]|nr:xanthine dehydrogenase family protein subunit M [Planktomarina sp.]
MTYLIPTKLEAALKSLAQQQDKIVAGGTDVYPSMKQGHTPKSLLDLTRIKELMNITETDTGFRIGAAVTWTEIVKAKLPAAFDGLKHAAKEVGSLQIQNAGTIAGNLCNASPAADGVPPLLTLDARVEVASAARGARILPLQDFILGVRKTALGSDEIVTAIHIPTPPDGAGSAFEKLGNRKYLVISIAMTAALIKCDLRGLISEARVAIGACSPVALRLTQLEADLIGAKPSEVEILPSHLSQLSPIDDVRGSGGYRLDIVQEQCRRAIQKAAENG